MTEKNLTEAQKVKLESNLHEKAKKVSKADLGKLLDKADSVKTKAAKLPEGFFDDVKLLWSMIQDYWNGSYTEIPWASVAMIVVALVYLINPIDIIPDFIPVLGYVDDAFVITLTLKAIQNDLEKYKSWKNA